MNGFGSWLARDLNALHVAAAMALAAYALFGTDSYALGLMTTAGAYALMVIGYQFTFGHAGALNLAQGAFFGLGAYTAAMTALKLGWGLELALPAAILLTGLIAALVALPVLRLETHYFALATLGIGQVVFLTAIEWTAFTGGSNGLYGLSGSARLFGAEIGRGLPLMLLVWAAVILGAAIAWRLARGRLGRELRLGRDSPLAADGSGVNRFGNRFTAFLLSAGFAAAGGALFIQSLPLISPEVLRFDVMVLCLCMTVIGGRTRIAGAILGAVLLTHLPEWFRFLERDYLLAYGVILLAVIVLAPEGIMGLLAAGRAHVLPEPARRKPSAVPLPQAPAPAPLRSTALTKRFGGNTALLYVSAQVRPGEILGIIGPNGSGKTTLLNILAGQYRAEGGSIRLDGRNITRWPAWRRTRVGIARTFQSPALAPAITALETVAAACRDEARAMACLERAGLGTEWNTPAGDLQPAQQRFLEIARALAVNPAILLLDEPAAGLSPDERKTLAALLRELAEEGRAIAVVEHTMGFLLPLADRLLCLDAGMTVAAGPPDAVAKDPAVIDAYLGAELEPGEPA